MKNQSLEHLMNEERAFPPNAKIVSEAHIKGIDAYKNLYNRSVEESHAFWMEQAETLEWFKKPKVSCRYVWDTKKREIHHTWFEDGVINTTVNCLDRHLKEGGEKRAIIWQGDGPNEERELSYTDLHREVCKFANVLKANGVKKGDRVCIYMPMVPELAVALLGCARIGAIHSVIFGGFSAESIVHRVHDSGSKLIITGNVSKRGGKTIPLKETVDQALKECPDVERVIVYARTNDSCPMQEGIDVWYHDEMAKVDAACEAALLNAEDPLFILYTSGSTGKPKGVVHTQAGYLLYVAMTHKYIFDIHDKDIYWCTADLGWITGHSYVIYGPLANHATSLMFEGIPTYPDAGRFWEIIDKYQVSVFYTAPTAIRALIIHGDHYPKKYKLDSLRVLGSVGEPINPEAWIWYHDVIGKGNVPVVDTWWQTETGGIMISALPGCHTLKPGSASQPFFGVEPVILKEHGIPCGINEGGALCIKKPWPGMMRTTWGDHDRFIDTYFNTFDNVYFTGDGCRVDADGDYWLLGRLDDVVNVSGHRIGTAEVESALVSHNAVAEAAVVPIPHDLKGQCLYAFVTLKQGVSGDGALIKALNAHVRQEIGSIAIPDFIQFAPALPKTRSGKIMRRILRKIAEGNDDLGDTSTLADPGVVHALQQGRKK